MASEFFWIVLFACPNACIFSTSDGGLILREYCEREIFEATCSDGEVILVQTAIYGRMRLGRCVRQVYQSIGCTADVLNAVDSRCSGRRTCQFHTSALHQHSTCDSDLVAYLEASYECVPVISCEVDVCSSGSFFPVVPSSGYLASSDAFSGGGGGGGGGCGSPVCPWQFSPLRGQRFNFTFYSFLVPEQPERHCHRLASIADKTARFSKDVTVCSGQEGRTVTHLTPDSVPVEVVMYSPSSFDSENPTFSLLRYEAIGCPDPTAPDGGWAKRKGDLLTVGCNRIRRTFHLTCDGTNWVGEAATCSEEFAETGPPATDQDQWDIGVALQQASSTAHGLLLIVGIGVVLGILFGFSMLTMAFVLIKRRRLLARVELREASHQSKADLSAAAAAATSNSSNNLYNQSMFSGGYGFSEKLSLADGASYVAYRLRSGGADQLIRQMDSSSSSSSRQRIRILGSCGRDSSSQRGLGLPPPPPPPPPPQPSHPPAPLEQTVVDECMESSSSQFHLEFT